VQDHSNKQSPVKDQGKNQTPAKRKGGNLQKKSTPKTSKKPNNPTEDSTTGVPHNDSAARAEEEIPFLRSVLVIMGHI
jgi:hypothetical protein